MVSEERINEYFEELDRIEEQLPDPPSHNKAVEKWLDKKFDELDKKYPDVIEWLKNETAKEIRAIGAP